MAAGSNYVICFGANADTMVDEIANSSTNGQCNLDSIGSGEPSYFASPIGEFRSAISDF